MNNLILSAWCRNPFLVGGLLWLCIEYFVAGPFSYFTIGENADAYIPSFMAHAAFFTEGTYWYPFAAAGTDRLSLGNFGGLDTFLFWLLPDWLTAQLFIVAQYVLGGGAAYLICRRILGLEREAATFAALAFALEASPGMHEHNTIMLFPVLIWAISRGLDENIPGLHRAAWLIGVPLAYGMCTLAVYLLHFPLVTVFIWFAVVTPTRSLRHWGLIAGACFLAVLPRLQDAAAIVLHAPQSHRIHWNMDIFQPPDFAEFLSYVSSFPQSSELNLLLVALAFCAWVLKRYGGGLGGKRLCGVSAVFVFFWCAPPLLEYLRPLVMYLFPFAEAFQIKRIALTIPFFAALMGGLGLEALIQFSRDRSVTIPRLGPVGAGRLAFLAGIGLLALFSLEVKYKHAYHWVKYGNYVKNFSNPIVKDFSTAHPVADDPYRIAAYQLYPALFHAYGLETAGGYMSLYSRRYMEFWNLVIKKRERQRGIEGQFLSWGSRVNLSADLREPRLKLGDHYNLSLLSLANVHYLFSRDQLLDPKFSAVVSADKPWNSLDNREKATVHVAANLGGENPLYIYRNGDAFPRFFLAPLVREFADETALLDAMAGAGAGALRESVFVEKGWLKEGVAENLGFSESAVELVSYAPDRIELNLRADGPAILAVVNSYSPYWQARVDGEAEEIFPAYHTFWGVAVAAGAHRVVFDYVPPYRLW
jgi:hypothetical protein